MQISTITGAYFRVNRQYSPLETSSTDYFRKCDFLLRFMPENVISDVRYGVKFGYRNIGWNGKFYTFPYFLAFMLKRFLKERP